VKRIIFSAPARADIRRLDRDAAMRIFTALHRFAETGQGDVKRLKGETEELRLRVGDYRVRFTERIRHPLRQPRPASQASLPLSWVGGGGSEGKGFLFGGAVRRTPGPINSTC